MVVAPENIPRLVGCLAGEVAKFGNVSTHIVALRIELQALRDRIEHPIEGGRVGATPGRPLPPMGVARDVPIA